MESITSCSGYNALELPNIDLRPGPAVTLGVEYSQPDREALLAHFGRVNEVYSSGALRRSEPFCQLVREGETATFRSFQLFGEASTRQIISFILAHLYRPVLYEESFAYEASAEFPLERAGFPILGSELAPPRNTSLSPLIIRYGRRLPANLVYVSRRHRWPGNETPGFWRFLAVQL